MNRDWHVLILIGAFFAVMPGLTIWAINTLFGTTIQHSLTTWCAALILLLTVKTS